MSDTQTTSILPPSLVDPPLVGVSSNQPANGGFSLTHKVRYNFRFYPTEPQKRQFAKEFGSARYAYNWGLQKRIESYKSGKPIGFCELCREWTKHRNDPSFPWIKKLIRIPQGQALRHLDSAYVNFFEKRSGFPKFKSKRGKQSASYVGDAFKYDAKNRNLSISKIGRLRVVWSRGFTSSPSSVTITKDCSGRYFVTLTLEEKTRALPKTGNKVGIDLGISHLATLSNGEKIANPKHTKKYEIKLAREQRKLARRVKGSGRYRIQKLKVAHVHAKIADTRRDCLNKITTDLVRRFDVLAIEDLRLENMLQNRHLSKSISDAAFGMFRRMLTYKCAWYGRELMVCDPFFPSTKTCSSCGHIHDSIPLNVRDFDCENCGVHHDRDENAAKNILAGGQPVKARGERVRRCKPSGLKRNARGNVNQPALKNG